MSHATADHPRRHRLSVDDYYRMAEMGILAPEARVELIEGEIIDMAPSGSLHAAAVHRLAEIFVRAVDRQAMVLVQNPLRLSQYSEPQPDIALVRRREDFYAERHPRASDALLVVEVADTSLRFDRDTKAGLYAAHAVPELWLVDVRGRQLHRYRTPSDGAYTLVDQPDLSAALALPTLAGVVVDLRRLFG